MKTWCKKRTSNRIQIDKRREDGWCLQWDFVSVTLGKVHYRRIDRINSISFKNVNGIPSFTNYLLLIFCFFNPLLPVNACSFQCRKCKANKEKVRSIKIQFLKSRKLRDVNISDRQTVRMRSEITLFYCRWEVLAWSQFIASRNFTTTFLFLYTLTPFKWNCL